MSRTENSIRNIEVALVGQLLGLLVKFLARMVFVRVLGAEYLGIDGLFTNILSVLSLAELGVGSAIVYSMYDPIAREDTEKLKSLMGLFKKTYTAIGLVILVLGIALTPFLQVFIKEMPDIPYIRLIFVMFVTNTAISYFFSYKRFLIIATQKKFIATIYRYSVFIALNILQILILLGTKNYLLFLGVEILATLIENILVSRKADRLFPYLKDRNILPLEVEQKTLIKKNIKALIYHRVGGVIVLGTDNLLISMLIGIVAVGIYSNYLLIISSLTMIYGLIFESITASVGNLRMTQTDERNRQVFNVANFLAFWIYGFSTIALFNLLNPFITLWVGGDLIFDEKIVLILCINFYLAGMRTSVRVFKDAYGLYWYDRYKPLAESLINIAASIMLAKLYGVIGIFMGTMISTIATSFWVEPYVLYKYGLKEKKSIYFRDYGLYLTVTVLAGIITTFTCWQISYDGVLGLMVKTIICAAIPNLIFFIFFRKSLAFKELFDLLKRVWRTKVTQR
ncbi:oligosaccharide flippase family protein [Eubacteriaceae bacterium ES2]|nr:oligosaccharide flippase family protein [Eubacteriaceae bacterium ES2]